MNAQAVGGLSVSSRGPADRSEVEAVESTRVHPLQDPAARGASLIRVDDG